MVQNCPLKFHEENTVECAYNECAYNGSALTTNLFWRTNKYPILYIEINAFITNVRITEVQL